MSDTKPYYHIDEDVHHIIAELIAKCTELNLGNVSFSYYREELDFYLSEGKLYWELTVSWSKTKRDVYRITDGAVVYRYSEKD